MNKKGISLQASAEVVHFDKDGKVKSKEKTYVPVKKER